jgi:hypothetical protein
MDATTMRRTAALDERLQRVDWAAVATWLLCFGLIFYLGQRGGGYDSLVHDPIGIAVWWIALVGVLVGALPRRPPNRLAWWVLALLAAFVVWTGLSLIWTESPDKTSADLARLAGYLGVLWLGVSIGVPGGGRRVLNGVACAIAAIAGVALLSRFHPAWFPDAAQTGHFLSTGRERLSYPLDYWNALAGLIAIGLPPLLGIAASGRSAWARGAAGATLPALALALFLTLSRGGIAAAAVALAIFLVFTSNRLVAIAALVPAAVGGALLIVLAAQRSALRHGLGTAVAHHQGNEMLAITVVVCVATGVAHILLQRAVSRADRPRLPAVSRSQALYGGAIALIAVVAAAAALGAPERVSDAWTEFKQSGGAGPGHGAERLSSVAGESRYQFWSAAVKEAGTKPLTGTGSGTFEYWWAREGTVPETVRDTHSLYLQTLGELGIVGLAILLAFLFTLLVGGGLRVVRAEPRRRPELAAALAGCGAFCFAAAFDWLWQMPVLPVATLLLASVLVTAKGAGAGGERRGSALGWPLRLGIAAVAVAAIVAIGVPYASTSQVRHSEADVRAGDLSAALSAARSAQNVQPGAAAPRLQEALVLELDGRLNEAAEAARAATAREATNWRNWLVLSRLEAKLGRTDAALRDFRRARSLNVHSALFGD